MWKAEVLLPCSLVAGAAGVLAAEGDLVAAFTLLGLLLCVPLLNLVWRTVQ